MSLVQKYEGLIETKDGERTGRHARLRRSVVIHELRQFDRQRVRNVASRLAKLDHPTIPHLIDLVEEKDVQFLIFEAAEHQPTSTGEFLDRMSRLENLASALGHAHNCRIVHGNLDAQMVRVDSKGEPKLVGLGIHQCRESSARIDRLSAEDVVQLKRMIATELRNEKRRLERDEIVDEEKARLVATFEGWLSSSPNRLRELSSEFYALVHQERMLSESKRLAVEASPSADVPIETNRIPIIAAVATVCGLVIISLLTFLFWPADSPQHVASDVRAEDTDKEPSARRLAHEPNVTSDLSNVGVLNNVDVERDSDTPEKDAQRKPGNGRTGESDSTRDKLSKDVVPENMEETEADGPERSVSPFADAPTDISLPPLDLPQPLALFTTDLAESEPLVMALLGRSGAFRQGEFGIESQSNRSWNITYTSKSESRAVASVQISSHKLSFEWNGDAPAASKHLRNTILELASGSWSHRVAMRQPEVRRAVQFSFERARPFDFKIDDPPDFSDVFIEFVPSTESLAKAFPKSVIPATDDMLKIGLDAGENSLVALHLESLGRGKLRPKAYARRTKAAKFQKIQPGFERAARASLTQLNQQLFVMKEGLKNIKGRDSATVRKRAESAIKTREQLKRKADEFAEAYLAAKQTKLGFEVYRKIGEHKLLLLVLKDE